MAKVKPGQPFGLDPEWIQKIDWQQALARVTQDLRSDFVYSPHLSFVYAKAGDQILAQVKKELEDGKFSPGVPMTIEVPKTFRIQVAVPSKRLGPSYSRPGSILLPKDRLLYQALADQAAPIIDVKTDHDRSFSHRLAKGDSPTMFVPTRTCWSKLQKANADYAKQSSVKYILRLDIANFFGSLNQHTLINVLNDVGYPSALSSRLECLLTGYVGERSSRGILQGMCPSDLLGNFYLTPIDQFLKELNVPSARYVDDLYLFVESVDAAEQLLRKLIPELRSYDLVLNEAKSKIMPASALIAEEPDLEKLFNTAVEEISAQIEEDDFDADYGFQSEWDDADGDEGGDLDDDTQELELAATKLLFDSISEYPGYEENIERFCLPLFARSRSGYAVAHVLDAFRKRPSMSQIYAAYLVGFLNDHDVSIFLVDELEDSSLMDWQKMWVLAALLQAKEEAVGGAKAALDVFQDASRHEALRAAAAIYVGRFGDHGRRKSLRTMYPSSSPYIQAAIYFSSRTWPTAERLTASNSWGAHSPLNQLLTAAMDSGKKTK
jgi:hypothetical protein